MVPSAKPSEYVLTLADSRATLELVGGKGTSLARLSAAGMPVPGGFHITTVAYWRVVDENDIQPRILAALDRVDSSQPATLDQASQVIRDLFAGAHVPEEVAAAIAGAYNDLPGHDPTVAVRSSATAEDLPGLSFAGQQETYLNIRGAAAVMEAVKQCWGSLWTPRAIGYRLRNNIDQKVVSLAVVVQLLVPADAAGVMFTANPVNSRRDESMISAAWGLGEAVVGGTVTPDSLVVEKSTGQVLQRHTAEKQVMTVRVPGGTSERSVPDDLRHAPVLNDVQAAELARLGTQIEELYGRPMDIEWVLKHGAFSIVQARPITTLADDEQLPETSVEWSVRDRGLYVHGGAFLELLTEPVSPLFSSLGLKSSDEAMRQWLDRYGLGDLMVYPLGVAVNGYVYGRIGYRPRPRHILGYIGLIREHMGAIEVWREELERYRQLAQEAQQVSLADLSSTELCGHVETLNKAAMTYWLFVGEVIRPVISRETRFTKYYKRLAQPGNDPEPQVLFRGGETLALQAERALYGLVELAREAPVVADALVEAPGDALRKLDGKAEAREFLQSFERYLDEYGYQMYSFDPLMPTLGEDPQPALLALQSYLRGQESPDARQERMKEERESAVARLAARLPDRKYGRLLRLMDEAREAARIREDAVFELGRAWRPLRRALLELGRRLIDAGATQTVDGVFWLQWNELLLHAADLDVGNTVDSLSGVVKKRQGEWRAWQDLQPPYVLPEGRKLPAWLRFVAPLPELQNQDSYALTGFAASPGKITGVARVIDLPEQMDRLAQGEILVARTTTPAWTPIFARTAAVVTDLGGALSHSSIVAREYGIPAVTGTGVASQRIIDGQVITVDGTNGKVFIGA